MLKQSIFELYLHTAFEHLKKLEHQLELVEGDTIFKLLSPSTVEHVLKIIQIAIQKFTSGKLHTQLQLEVTNFQVMGRSMDQSRSQLSGERFTPPEQQPPLTLLRPYLGKIQGHHNISTERPITRKIPQPDTHAGTVWRSRRPPEFSFSEQAIAGIHQSEQPKTWQCT